MDDGVIWNKSPHTAAKHNILRKYVQAWSAILAQGSSDRRIIYIDGFAGPGEYIGGEDGSPILVLKSLKEHQLREKFRGTEFVNIFIEKNPKRCQNLEKVIEKRVKPLPNWIKYDIRCTEFNTEMKRILRSLESEGKNLAPCLCFVDPFGWNDIDYGVLSTIMKYEKAELLITFMAGYLERFVWDPVHIPSIKALYSNEQIEAIKENKDEENLVTKYFLENLTKNIRNAGVIERLYNLSFAAYNNHNRLEYYLIYLTKNCKGIKAMKGAMFDSARDGSYKFSDFNFDPNQTTLVDYGQEYHWVEKASSDIYMLLLSEYGAGRRIAIPDVKSLIDCYSNWLYKAGILSKLEEKNKIEVIAENRRRGTFPDRGYITLK